MSSPSPSSLRRADAEGTRPSCPLARAIVALLIAAVSLGGSGSTGAVAQTSADEIEIRRIHREVIRAHVENLPDLWMSLESAEYISVNGGRISFPSASDRLAGRRAYLDAATFTRYEDLREPVVRISDDGTLAWLVAEVAVSGSVTGADGELETFDDVWAWIELYERGPEGWRIVGNASNRRPGEDGGRR